MSYILYSPGQAQQKGQQDRRRWVHGGAAVRQTHGMAHPIDRGPSSFGGMSEAVAWLLMQRHAAPDCCISHAPEGLQQTPQAPVPQQPDFW